MKCSSCDHIVLDPPPSPDVIERMYGAGYFEEGTDGGYRDYVGAERWHRRNARARLTQLAGFGARPPGRLLEIGSAFGFLVDEATKAGWQASGVEISSYAREVAAGLGVQLYKSVDETEGAFDAVVAVQVIEHLVNPRDLLEELHDLTVPGGLIQIESWDRSALVARLLGKHWQQITPPSVVHLFDRSGLEALLQRTGFQPIETKGAWKWVSLGNALGLGASKYPRALGRVALGKSLRSTGVPYRLGDLITVTARRS